MRLEKSADGRAPSNPRKNRNFEGGGGLLVVHGGNGSRDAADAEEEVGDACEMSYTADNSHEVQRWLGASFARVCCHRCPCAHSHLLSAEIN